MPIRPALALAEIARAAWGLAALCLAYGLYRVAYVPDDYQQGATVKIMRGMCPPHGWPVRL